MTENKFGKISRLSIRTGSRDGKTILEDLSFTAPYKVMTPFPKEDGGISIMPLCASKEAIWNFFLSLLIKCIR